MIWRNVLGFDPTSQGPNGSGWIPPHNRSASMLDLDATTRVDMPRFKDINSFQELPDECILADLEIKCNGSSINVWQRSGSCVGAGAAKAYIQAAAGDVCFRGDNETVKFCFPWATYGIGRKLAGMRSTGEGSFGTAQAKACATWGLLAVDHPDLPTYDPSLFNEGWLSYSEKLEINWSHPIAWPISEEVLRKSANENQILLTAQVHAISEVISGLAQGYGITLASSFGSRSQRVIDGFLMAEWDDTWYHQMSCGGYSTHPRYGKVFWIQNQWGPRIHPICPKMITRKVTGGFWISEATFTRIIKSGEVFVHSNTEGFPARKLNWGTMGIV